MDSKADGGETLDLGLIDMAIECWRFGRLFGRVVSKLDAGEASRYINQQRYFLKRVSETLSQAGFRLVDLEGQPYDPGIAATALNISDFGPDDSLIIDQMVEPIVMGSDGLRRSGVVLLRKVQQ